MVEAIALVSSVVGSLEEMRADAEQAFNSIFSEVEKHCDVTSVPRQCKKQKNRVNVEDSSPQQYYRKSISTPFLDAIIGNFKQRFHGHRKNAMKLGLLVPSSIDLKIKPSELHGEISELCEFWRGILPECRHDSNCKLMRRCCNEWDIWHQQWKATIENNSSLMMPEDVISSIKMCDERALPIIHKLLNIFATQPVSTATPERSFSALRRLKTWLRNKTKENRLTGLALMHLCRNHISQGDGDEVLNLFSQKKARKLKLIL